MNSLGLFFNFLWAMILVVGLAYVAARLLKKMGWGKVSHAQYLEQIDYLPLGPKRGIALVQIADKTVALGVTEQTISLLMEVDADAITRQAPTASRVVSTTLPPFAEELWRKLRRGEGKS
ncbi:MAG: flagellar biosynthetic protein FliO [Sulfobacillus thermotolerans]|nr:flagellar biosynthetic protein FliO [Sulfobacillus thermotolerans]